MSPTKDRENTGVPSVARKASGVANNNDVYHGHEHLSTKI
jgi:hypothetical protein